MFFNSTNVKSIFSNKSIINIFKLPNNDDDHMVAISDDSELLEFNNIIISKCMMERPKEEFLKDNGHICNKQIKVTKVYHKLDSINIGYEDGLVLVWKVETVNTGNMQDVDKSYEKNYCNIFKIQFIFIGHTRKILEILSHDNILITTGEDLIMKIWNLNNGHQMYKFSLDSLYSKIFYICDKKIENLIIVSTDSFIINLNIKKEPPSFIVNKFEYENFNDIIFDDNKFYVSAYNEIIILNNKFELIEKKITENGSIMIQKFGNHFIIVTYLNKINYIRLTDENLSTLFWIPICQDTINHMYISGNKVFISCLDKNMYIINIVKELNLYRERIKMKEEERNSIQYNIFLEKESKKRSKSGKKKSKPGTANTNRSKSSNKNDRSKLNSAESKVSKPGTAGSQRTKSNRPESQQNKKLEVIKEKKKK